LGRARSVGAKVRAVVILAMATVSALAAGQGARTLSRAAEAPPAAPLREAVSLDAETPAKGDAAVRKAADGHYWAEARVQGRHVRFLVDTGASTVALTAADAKRLGIVMNALSFDVPVSTASGQAMAARVTLDDVSVAGARVEDVDAVVMREGLEVSLLGMTYLGRLSRFEATGDSLILRR
jgi:aspartyl protease family protein